jgi:sugar phosphate isomerase/epimerase
MEFRILNCIRTIDNLNVDEANSLGYGIELQDFVEPNLKVEEKKLLLSKYSLEFQKLIGLKALHGPFLDLKPSSPDLLIREASRMKYAETLDIAEYLKVDYVIFHSQINPYLSLPSLRKLNARQAADYWKEALSKTKYKGIILLENIFEETPDMLKELLDEINDERVRVNLDIGHLRLGKSKLSEWVQSLNKYLAYIHVHGNDGRYDTHMPPTDADIFELASALADHNVSPVLALEYKVKDMESELKRYRQIVS